MRGARVSLTSLESVPQEGRLGEKAGERVAGWLKEVGVELALGRPVASIASSCVGHMVTLEDGTSLEAETVLLGTGVKPHSALAVDAGIPVAENRIMVDASMRSSVPGVWAAGDVAHAFNPAAGRRLMVEHWGEALNQGAVAGRRLAGEEARWDDVPGFWSTIVDNTLKYRAWGDGFDDLRVEEDGPGFTVWYGRDGILVGALTHGKDDDYERSSALIAAGERF
jgi:NADPH-dependent 2,4-dienoyl-CoA reductase/sulfur reductase-like enzyme